MKARGFGGAYCPGCMHSMAFVDFPVDVGRHRQTNDPDRPVIVHPEWAPTNPGHPAERPPPRDPAETPRA